MKDIDKFQIIGFVLSAAISLILILRGQDTVISITLGLVLATLTQLFDLQMRNAEAEERLLQANLLNRKLFDDDELLAQIRQIVDDYYAVKNSWFSHFKEIARDSVTSCQYNLHTLANGYIGLKPFSPFAYSAKGFRNAKVCAYTVALGNMQYWRSSHATKYIQSNKDAIQRGVKVVRIFVQHESVLREYNDILVAMQEMGVDLYTVSPESIPSDLKRDMNIIDEKILVQLELTEDGSIREDTITVDPIKVRQAMNDFDKLKGFAAKFDSSSAK